MLPRCSASRRGEALSLRLCTRDRRLEVFRISSADYVIAVGIAVIERDPMGMSPLFLPGSASVATAVR